MLIEHTKRKRFLYLGNNKIKKYETNEKLKNEILS